MASLAAVARVLKDASVWPFATSDEGVSVETGSGADRDERTLVAFLGGTGGGTLNGLRGLVDGVPEDRC